MADADGDGSGCSVAFVLQLAASLCVKFCAHKNPRGHATCPTAWRWPCSSTCWRKERRKVGTHCGNSHEDVGSSPTFLPVAPATPQKVSCSKPMGKCQTRSQCPQRSWTSAQVALTPTIPPSHQRKPKPLHLQETQWPIVSLWTGPPAGQTCPISSCALKRSWTFPKQSCQPLGRVVTDPCPPAHSLVPQMCLPAQTRTAAPWTVTTAQRGRSRRFGR